MKVIFLDFDGVLNSAQYDKIRDLVSNTNLDETRMPLLKRIVDETGAVIVLSTSWRSHWHKKENECSPIGVWINAIFAKYGMTIYDKTPQLSFQAGRQKEILSWLEYPPERVESYVILDDDGLGWGKLSDRLIKTSPHIGKGLEEEHVQKAIALLNGMQPPWKLKNGEGPFDKKMVDTDKKISQKAHTPLAAQNSIDPLYVDALKAVVESGVASISFVQRKMGTGYSKAGKIIEWMEMNGYISKFDSKNGRSVYLTKEEFERKFVRGKMNMEYIPILKFAVEHGVVSVSILQRQLRIVLKTATAAVEWMENMGYATTHDGVKPRKVLLTMEEFEKLLNG